MLSLEMGVMLRGWRRQQDTVSKSGWEMLIKRISVLKSRCGGVLASAETEGELPQIQRRVQKQTPV